MWTKFIFNLLVLFVGIHFVLSAEVEKCTGVPNPSVEIKGCEKPPCPLVRGSDIKMIINFNSSTASEYSNELELKVQARVGPVIVSLPLPRELSDVSRNLLNTNCPLNKD
ncbi:hypothetical protein ILUMI_14084 [Ignelater luminosus]|uniref:MD-2-related lipid-recognition domain-containing protein n=1 Tax=Ignelater luminosus TaxID=2038154 RepID=A0A8K0CR53_IGNLU|nr:hypothetical protein ILUMI_14084 [Ignelater luminosus]